MADVSRSLLIPDFQPPSDHLLKTLAVYWDEVVLVGYVERGFGKGSGPRLSETATTLRDAGALTTTQRSIDLSDIYTKRVTPASTRVWMSAPPEIHGQLRQIEEGSRDLAEGEEPILTIVGEEPEEKLLSLALAVGAETFRVRVTIPVATALLVYSTSKHYLARVLDALDTAEANHLAPRGQFPAWPHRITRWSTD
jgi:hypothetical protein